MFIIIYTWIDGTIDTFRVETETQAIMMARQLKENNQIIRIINSYEECFREGLVSEYVIVYENEKGENDSGQRLYNRENRSPDVRLLYRAPGARGIRRHL